MHQNAASSRVNFVETNAKWHDSIGLLLHFERHCVCVSQKAKGSPLPSVYFGDSNGTFGVFWSLLNCFLIFGFKFVSKFVCPSTFSDISNGMRSLLFALDFKQVNEHCDSQFVSVKLMPFETFDRKGWDSLKCVREPYVEDRLFRF